MVIRNRSRITLTVLAVIVVAASVSTAVSQSRPLTFEDLMKFRTIHDTVISEDGTWIAYQLKPDRGDAEVVIRSIEIADEIRVERGKKPVISKDARWVAVAVSPTFEELEKDEKDKNGPKDGMALVSTGNGSVTLFDNVEKFAFSDDARWLAYKRFEVKDESEEDDEKKKTQVGTTLVLRDFLERREEEIAFVTDFAFDEPSRYLAYTTAGPEGKENGLFLRDLATERESAESAEPRRIVQEVTNGRFTALAWAKARSRLAFVAAVQDDEGETGPAALWTWESEVRQAVDSSQVGEGWMIPSKNELTWSEDGARVFFGRKPEKSKPESEESAEEEEVFSPYDRDAILAKREVDVWHWNDPLIVTHQKEIWDREKDRTYGAVFHFDSAKVVPLADLEMREVEPAENADFALGLADVPHLKRITWEGRFRDVYLVSLKDGSKTAVVNDLQETVSLSPGGRFVLYYEDGDWYLYDAKEASRRNLTEGLDVPFADEDHDFPSEVPGYGIGGWTEGDRAVLIYDKYDVWQFPTDGATPVNLTGGRGRSGETTFRLVDLDEDQHFLRLDEDILLTAYHQKRKNWGFYRARLDGVGVTSLLEEDKQFRFIAKAKNGDRILYTRESYSEFPDIWTSDLTLAAPQKLSEANPQIADFAWGSAELVEWSSLDGIPLQGVLIKPGNYQPGKRYPVLVYYYRFFSQRLNEFNEPVVNHRPSFPLYASNGYVVFLPDIRFEVGRPGFSATKCLVPGVQKLIDMGVADPDAIGLHGHSWSGYQTAFVITQTDIFAAAVAGAPVSNMTSAYSGIRWESGLARQFQYEQTQSRIGGSLWEYPERYIENSPVFFADKIHTPLLTMFGDEDGAVPWYQGIELYLATRRLGKESIFLQYRGEPHHPQKYANKLDYAIKMKQYFDHYLKGEPAPDWITKGVPYQGK